MTALSKSIGRFTEADIDSEIVIMRLDNGEFFSLSGTSAAIWRLIDGSRDREALLTILTGQFDAKIGDIATDLDDFIQDLKRTGLLVE